jgi:hypothetical protein
MDIVPPHFASPPTDGVTKQQQKGHSTTSKIEHIDLLRLVPWQEEKASSTSGRLSEFEGEE